MSLPQEYAIFWGISHIALVLLLIKLIPKVIQLFEYSRNKVNLAENIQNQIRDNTNSIKTIQEQTARDYQRINQLEKLIYAQQDIINDSLQESELMLKSLMHISQGLQELGANGPTKESEHDIQEYLIRKSHKRMVRNNSGNN